jgi:hypothetical protein
MAKSLFHFILLTIFVLGVSSCQKKEPAPAPAPAAGTETPAVKPQRKATLYRSP